MTWTLTLVRIVFGPELFALVAALTVTLARRARPAGPPVVGAVRGWTVVAVLAATGVVLLGVFSSLPAGPSVPVLVEHRYVVPLLAGLVGVVLCLVPVVRRPTTGSADLSRRTPTTFAPRWWFAALAVVVAVLLLVTVLAGLASRPDEDGRYTMHHVDFGAAAMGTGIYGWYYSVPALVVMAALLLAAVAASWALARPPVAHEARTADVAIRRWRTRNVLALAAGALLVHLAVVLRSLAGTASARAMVTTAEGAFGAGSTFAALEAPLRVASTAVEVGGWFLWFAVLFAAAVPALRRRSVSPWHSASR